MINISMMVVLALGASALPQGDVKFTSKSTSTVTGCEKPDAGNCTQVEWQDGRINWGNVVPADAIGALILDPNGICNKFPSTCSTSESQKQEVPTTLIKCLNGKCTYIFKDDKDHTDSLFGHEAKETIKFIISSSDMPNDDVKKMLILTLQASIKAVTEKRVAVARHPGRAMPKWNYDFDQYFAPNFAYVVLQPDDDPTQHFSMQLTIESTGSDPEGGNCDKVTAVGAGLVGAISGFLGPLAPIASAINLVGKFACPALGG